MSTCLVEGLTKNRILFSFSLISALFYWPRDPKLFLTSKIVDSQHSTSPVQISSAGGEGGAISNYRNSMSETSDVIGPRRTTGVPISWSCMPLLRIDLQLFLVLSHFLDTYNPA